MSDAPADPREPVLETQVVASTVLADPGPRFTAGGVISRTIRVWWSNFWAFSAISVAVFAPVLAGVPVSWMLSYRRTQAGGPLAAADAPTLGALIGVAGALTLLLSVVEMGAVTYGTIRWLAGERAPLGRMVGVGFRRGLPVVGTLVVLWLGTVAGSLVLLVPGITFLVASCVALPSAVVERAGVAGAFRRSFALTRGSRWAVLAAGLVVMVLQLVLSAGVQVGLMVVASVLSPAWALGGGLVAAQLGSAIFSVLPYVALAVCYHDLRLAKEGVDTAQLAKVFE